jgi:hypothetical protein
MVLPVIGEAASVAQPVSGPDIALAHEIEDPRNPSHPITPPQPVPAARRRGPDPPAVGGPPPRAADTDSHGRTDHPKTRLTDQG